MRHASPPPAQLIGSVVAVFDFDGTLTRRDSLLPFLHWAVGRFRFWWGILVLSPMLLRYALRLIPNWRAKEAMLSYFFANWSEERLDKVGQRFAVQVLPQLLRPEALQRVRWHQEQQHHLVILSASLEAYLRPLGESMGFDHVISTRLEVQWGIVSGRILGKNCYGQEKVERLKAYLGDLSEYCLYAYGDSLGDRELLNAANYPYYRTFDHVSPF